MFTAAGTLSDGERRRDRGAFFGSIHATLNHLLWGDRLWLSRFGGCDKPAGGIADSTAQFEDWADLKAMREVTDTAMVVWADVQTPETLDSDFHWVTSAGVSVGHHPRWKLIVQMFNHGTHHRGQVNALLTAAGATLPDTDIQRMPGFVP
ncbi:MAG: DinB family protein [Pseudomonadota bacterium]